MLTREVKDWLSEYKGLSSSEVLTFASNLMSNEELILDLFNLFEATPYYVQELDPVCHQLYEFYRSKEAKLQPFALQYVPTLIWLYLRNLSHGDKKVCSGAETFLLGVYNLEIIKPDGTPVIESIRVPTISKASIYHESRIPGVTEPLTEHALRSLNNSHSLWRTGPFPQHERFNGQNRFSILSFVMQKYNSCIDSFHTCSLRALCTALSRLSDTGFIKPGGPQPRISLFPSLLVEFLMATYFALFNGHKKLALAAIQSTHSRACFELYSDVLLITNAMLNSHHRGNFRFEGHEVNLDAQKTANAVKHRITNASFKAKKLPDDIDIVEDDESTKLSTVEEDQEHSLAKNLKAKLMNKLGVDKNKNRETVRRNSDTPSMKSGSGSEIVENLGVAIRNSSGGAGMHVMVDHLEMVPLKVNGSIDDDKISSADGKHVKSSSSPTIYSKKSNLMKTLSGSDQPSKGHQLMSPHNSKNSTPSLKSPLSKALTPDPANSARAQSEGPTVLSDRSLSDRSAFQRDQMGSVASYSNASDPNLRTHGTLPSISVSSHSMPADIVSNSNSEKSSGGKQLVNRNSFSTDL